MNEVGVFVNVKDRAVGGKPRTKMSRDSRRKLSTDGRGSDENCCRLYRVHESRKGCGVILNVEGAQFRFVADVNLVDAVMQNFLRLPIDAVAEKNGVHGLIDFGGEFPRLADKLVSDRMNLSVHVVNVNRNAAPSRFVDCWCCLFDELKNALALPDAEFAEAAG